MGNAIFYDVSGDWESCPKVNDLSDDFITHLNGVLAQFYLRLPLTDQPYAVSGEIRFVKNKLAYAGFPIYDYRYDTPSYNYTIESPDAPFNTGKIALYVPAPKWSELKNNISWREDQISYFTEGYININSSESQIFTSVTEFKEAVENISEDYGDYIVTIPSELMFYNTSYSTPPSYVVYLNEDDGSYNTGNSRVSTNYYILARVLMDDGTYRYWSPLGILTNVSDYYVFSAACIRTAQNDDQSLIRFASGQLRLITADKRYQRNGADTIRNCITMIDPNRYKYYMDLLGIPYTSSLDEIRYSNSSDFVYGGTGNEDGDDEPGEGPGEGGGGGSDDITSDPIPVPGFPLKMMNNSGFINIYNPSMTQVFNFATYLWNNMPSFENLPKFFSDPMEYFISMHLIPVTPVKEETNSNIIVGKSEYPVEMPRVIVPYTQFDCGEIVLSRVYGSAFDYAPYTKAQVFLPFIGYRPLDIDVIMNHTIGIKYNIDVTTGLCVAFITVDGNVKYQFYGSCSMEWPISKTDRTEFYKSAINAIASTATGAAVLATTGNPAIAVGAGVGIASSTVGALMSNKNKGETAGSLAGPASLMGVRVPHLLLEIPRLSTPTDYPKFVGYPSNIYETLGNCSGFTAVQSVHLENISATSNELDEIERLLMEGVFL